MIENIVPLVIPPGHYRNGTVNQGAGRWVNGSLVRFLEGTVRPVGGWRVAQGPAGNDLPAVAGIPRHMHGWRDSTGAYRVAVATTTDIFMLAGGVVTTVTPTGFPTDARVNGSYTPSNATTGAGPLGSTFNRPDTWTLGTFGNYLVAVATRTGTLYVQTDPAAPPAPVTAAPAGLVGLVVTAERFLFVLGSTTDQRLVSWPSQETTTVWTPSDTNTAGNFTLATNGKLIAGISTPGYTLLFTDVDVWAASYIGGLLVYRFDQKGANCGLLAPHAATKVDTQVFWMGRDAFFTFDGYAKALPCEVSDYVFGDFNLAQRDKVWAVSNTQAREVWWYYPSSTALEPDRYVVYNYAEQHWTTGTLGRNAGIDAGVVPFPVMADAAGFLYEHEYGTSHGGLVPVLESGPLSLGNGDNVVKVQRVIPDERTLGATTITFLTSMWPTDPVVEHGPFALSAPTSVRFTTRLARIRITEAYPSNWRIGTVRLGAIAGGRR